MFLENFKKKLERLEYDELLKTGYLFGMPETTLLSELSRKFNISTDEYSPDPSADDLMRIYISTLLSRHLERTWNKYQEISKYTLKNLEKAVEDYNETLCKGDAKRIIMPRHAYIINNIIFSIVFTELHSITTELGKKYCVDLTIDDWDSIKIVDSENWNKKYATIRVDRDYYSELVHKYVVELIILKMSDTYQIIKYLEDARKISFDNSWHICQLMKKRNEDLVKRFLKDMERKFYETCKKKCKKRGKTEDTLLNRLFKK